MDRVPFEFVCVECLTSHGVVDNARLPEACPSCGAGDPWVGPFAKLVWRDPDEAERVFYTSPFYLSSS
jgi:hypothetical protein